MFIQNKYSKYYFSIIGTAKSRLLDPTVYYEKHHIIPKSCGGSNSKENLVSLTAREHFICHLLLPKMLIGDPHHKMVHALWRMCNSLKSSYKVNARTYRKSREKHAVVMSVVGTTGQFKIGHSTWNKGIPRTDAVKQAVSLANTGRKRPDRTSETFTTEWKSKISESKKGKQTWNKGVSHSEASKELMSSKAKLRPKKTCLYCNTEASPANYIRWHGDKCRTKS